MLRKALAAVGLILLGACRTHDPQKELLVSDVETYWVVDAPKGATQLISPAVRFRLRNQTKEPIRAIQAMANFKRVGEQENWGSAWEQVTPASNPLGPGKDLLVVLRSDGHYTSPTAEPESMFKHELFKDARAEVFVRVGSSSWTRMSEVAIERRIGAKSVQELGAR
jgi:hypothetical protein